jgi:hypothetical protein
MHFSTAVGLTNPVIRFHQQLNSERLSTPSLFCEEYMKRFRFGNDSIYGFQHQRSLLWIDEPRHARILNAGQYLKYVLTVKTIPF